MITIKTLHNELFQGVIVILIFFLLLLTSCGGSAVRSESIPSPRTSPDTKAERLNMKLAQKGTELQKAFSTADYKIGPEDLLEITVFQAKELDTIVRVSASGYIKLALIDKIEASGRTVYELESLICKKLEQYLTEPVVSVFIKEYRSQQIAVLGSVKNPSVFYVTGQRYLLDLLSMAGGLSPDAGEICIVQRGSSGNESKDKKDIEKIVIDLDALLVRGNIELNIPMFSGDVVHVPQAGIFFVDGAVRGPGSFPLKGKITLTQAISMAKGLNFDAVHSNIKIYRDTGKSEREIITLDYDSVLDGNSTDIEIKDKDVIIADRSGFKGFLGRIATGLSFGIFHLGTMGMPGAAGF